MAPAMLLGPSRAVFTFPVHDMPYIIMIMCSIFISDRPYSYRLRVLDEFNGGASVAFAHVGNGSTKWKFMKKCMLQALRMHGDGLQRIEGTYNFRLTYTYNLNVFFRV